MADRRPSPMWSLVLTSIPFFMVALDTLVVITALPAIRADLHASLATLEWTVNAYTLAFAAGIITAAALGDRYGRRRVFSAGLALFTAASAACALSPTIEWLIAARTVQGVGAALVTPLSLTILSAAFPARRRGAIVGLWGGIGGLAVAGGPLIGGALTQGLAWHWIFWVNVPIGTLATLLALYRLPESRGAATKLDPAGVTLSASGATAIVYGLVQANEVGWTSLQTLATLGVGIVLIAAFIALESRVAAPMLPLRLFRSRAFSATGAAVFLQAGALFSAAFMAAQYFQLALRYPPFEAGLRLLPWTITPVIVSPIAGALSDRIGRRRVLVTGLTLQGLGIAWVSALASVNVDYAALVAPLVIAGVGVSMAIPASSTAIVSAVAPADIGKASGVNSTLQRFGSAFAVAAATAVFAASGSLVDPASFVAGFRPAFALSAGLSFLGAFCALAMGAARPVRAPATIPAGAAAE